MFLESLGAVLTPLAVVQTSLVLFVFWTLKTFYDKRHIFKFARNYPGYRFFPVIGNGYAVIGKDSFGALQQVKEKFGLPCSVWLGHTYLYITVDASEIKIILNHPSTFDKSTLYDSLKILFKRTLTLAPVDVWKPHRKFYSKSFSQPMLNSFVQYFYKKSTSLLEVLKDTEHKDLFLIFERYTFDSFCESVIGTDFNFQINPKVEIVEWLTEFQTIYGRRILSAFYYPLILFSMSSEGRRAVALRNKVRNFIFEIIREKRKAFVENPVIEDSDAPLPLLDAMLRAEGEKFSDQHIFDEMFLFTTAAFDTSGITMAYTFTLLGMHKHVQDEIYEEVMAVVGKDRPIYYEDLPNLKYTERAIMESMRILPTAPYMGRLTTADIDVGTKVIPKGVNVVISVFNLHRNEKYWPDPLKYDPDRFLPEEVAKRDPYTYIPFSGGPRNCIGKTYAIMQVKTVVANVVRHYEISSKYKSVSELELTACVTMKTTHPLDCRFKPRIQE